MKLGRNSICCMVSVLLCISNLVYAKNKIYLANNEALVSAIPASESSFNLQITLKPGDDFSSWSLGFFMLHLFNNPNKYPFTARICKQSNCTDLIIDTNSNKVASSINEYIKPELSVGHVTLFKPVLPFILENGATYVVSINGLKNIPQNITAMPMQLFILADDGKNIIPINTSSNTSKSYNYMVARAQTKYHNYINWYKTNTPKIIDSIVVPYPVKTELGYGIYTANASPKVNLCRSSSSDSNCLPIAGQSEGYMLKIRESGIQIYANADSGVFYAKGTLEELNSYYSGKIPVQTITDYPRFKYRGFMLDTARHFFTVNEIKKLLDIMSIHKLNVLRLHLADDEAWRLQLVNYPKLTSVGSSRAFGKIIGPSNLVDDKYDITNLSKEHYATADTVYNGFYSESDIRGLISYANERQITIIPEIELPAHAKALKKAMPEVFFDPSDKSVYYSVQGYTDSVMPICKYGSDTNFTNTLNGIIRDIANLFANQTTINYVKNEVSLSADEVPENAFTNYPACNMGVYKNLRGEKISHEFFKQLSMKLPGYKLSGYGQLVHQDNGEVSKNALDTGSVGHVWQWLPTTQKPVSGLKIASNLSEAGYLTVLDFANLTYFDIRYSSKWDEPGLYWSANQTDTFSALISGLSLDYIQDTSHIAGIEGDLWSELVPSSSHMFYMILPKMAGLADASWSQQKDISWRSLALRLGCGQTGFLAYLNKQYNVRYRGYPHGISEEVPVNHLCNQL